MGISLNPSALLSGQGIDVSSLVQEIMSESSGQLTEWQNEQTTLQGQASDLTAINNDLSNLATAMQALSDPTGAMAAISANSSDSSVLTANASSSAAPNSYQVVVTSLATQGTVYTDGFSAGADSSILPSGVTSGEIDLQIGGSSGTTEQIQINAANNNETLNNLATYITGQNWGVTASVMTDATGSHLIVQSQSAGSAGALSITSNNTDLSFAQPTGGTNGVAYVNGIPYSSTTDTIVGTGAISGVTLNLASAAPDETVQLTVGPNTSQMTTAVNNFVSAYNQVINDINQEFTVNASTNSEGPLGSDAALRSLQSSLLNDVTYSLVQNGQPVNLASFGINMNDDGTLTVGTNPAGQTMAQAIAANPTAFQSFFQNATSTGFANNFNTDLNNLTAPVTGVLNADLTSNQNDQQSLSTTITNFETQLTAEQQQLTSEFDAVNASLEEYPLLLQSTTETLAALDSSSSSSTTASPTLTSGL